MDPQTVPIPILPAVPVAMPQTAGVPTTAVVPVGSPTVVAPRRPFRPDDRRSRMAAAVGVAVVGVAAVSTAVFQSVVGASTTLPMGAPAEVAAAAPAGH